MLEESIRYYKRRVDIVDRGYYEERFFAMVKVRRAPPRRCSLANARARTWKWDAFTKRTNCANSVPITRCCKEASRHLSSPLLVERMGR